MDVKIKIDVIDPNYIYIVNHMKLKNIFLHQNFYSQNLISRTVDSYHLLKFGVRLLPAKNFIFL